MRISSAFPSFSHLFQCMLISIFISADHHEWHTWLTRRECTERRKIAINTAKSRLECNPFSKDKLFSKRYLLPRERQAVAVYNEKREWLSGLLCFEIDKLYVFSVSSLCCIGSDPVQSTIFLLPTANISLCLFFLDVWLLVMATTGKQATDKTSHEKTKIIFKESSSFLMTFLSVPSACKILQNCKCLVLNNIFLEQNSYFKYNVIDITKS